MSYGFQRFEFFQIIKQWEKIKLIRCTKPSNNAFIGSNYTFIFLPIKNGGLWIPRNYRISQKKMLFKMYFSLIMRDLSNVLIKLAGSHPSINVRAKILGKLQNLKQFLGTNLGFFYA